MRAVRARAESEPVDFRPKSNSPHICQSPEGKLPRNRKRKLQTSGCRKAFFSRFAAASMEGLPWTKQDASVRPDGSANPARRSSAMFVLVVRTARVGRLARICRLAGVRGLAATRRACARRSAARRRSGRLGWRRGFGPTRTGGIVGIRGRMAVDGRGARTHRSVYRVRKGQRPEHYRPRQNGKQQGVLSRRRSRFIAQEAPKHPFSPSDTVPGVLLPAGSSRNICR